VNPELPKALVSRNPVAWLGLFGPGAVIASLTIGAGELIFSSRGGAIFGYRLLGYFALVLLFKWVLVYGIARQMVLTGIHPFERWIRLGGPRGWLTLLFLGLGVLSFPIWVAFHAGTTGGLLASLTGTSHWFRGSGHYAWGLLLLGIVLWLISKGGYERLEKLQISVVILMLASVLVSLFLLHPDWTAILKGALFPQPLTYPEWVSMSPEFVGRPVWVEVVTYVGIIGGSGYDYLAYGAYLREKGWGASDARDTIETLPEGDSRRALLRRWLRAPMVDCTLSFLAVLLFSGVFVACGAMLLAPKHELPSGSNLLSLQASFVGDSFSWMRPLYFFGAFLTMFGTLYGTVEVAPAILREMARALRWNLDGARRIAVRWCGGGGVLVLCASILKAWFGSSSGSTSAAPGLVLLLTPANLFTGVMACGIVCLSNVWTELRFIPRDFRARPLFIVLSLIGGVMFLLIGLKAYWDHGQWDAMVLLGSTILLGCGGAKLRSKLTVAKE